MPSCRKPLERERAARDEVHASARAIAERESELEHWAGELGEQEETLARRVADLEREQSALVERHTEIVAEYARVQELAGHAEGRVEELETAERDRAEAAGELAKQLAEISERERELKRERAAYEARQQEAEARLVLAREHRPRTRRVSGAARARGDARSKPRQPANVRASRHARPR